MSEDSNLSELLQLTQKLLDSIASGDWTTYAELCDPTLTAMEPEAPGQLISGLNFHRFYFDLGGVRGPNRTTICAPHVRLMDKVGIVCYTRLVQKMGDEGKPVTVVSTETRVWQNKEGCWKHVHFHRSAISG